MPSIGSNFVILRRQQRDPSSSFPGLTGAAECGIIVYRAATLCLIRFIVGALTLLPARAVHADPLAANPAQFVRDPFAASVTEAALRSGIPASWIRGVMQVESGGNARALSAKGAMGLMQIMPRTWVELRSRLGLGADPFDPRNNILAGGAYLRELHDRYGSPGFLAAYNAGPARYDDHLATGRPLPTETRAYLALLAPLIGDGAIDDSTVVTVAADEWTDAPLFTVQSATQFTSDQAAADPQFVRPANGNHPENSATLTPRSNSLFVRTSRGGGPT
jgi:hypothetical protein